MIETVRQNYELFLLIGLISAVGAAMLWAIIYYFCYAVQSQILGSTVWCGNLNDQSVALTFDDGPSPDTLEILDVLRRENVKATFFLIGRNVAAYPEIARKIAADGHEIGNHSYSHPIYLFCSAGKVAAEIEKTQHIIKQTTGINAKIARPPCGVRSKGYFAAARKFDLQTIQWSDTGFDWKKISAEKIAENVLKTVQSDSIILLHDGDSQGKSDRRATAESLPLIFKQLKAKGLDIVPRSELCLPPHFNFNICTHSLKGEKKV